MEYRITDNMRRIRENANVQIAAIQSELYIQKYGRPPTVYEYFDIEEEIKDVAKEIFRLEIAEKYGLEAVV